jgi:hypothetical protein
MTKPRPTGKLAKRIEAVFSGFEPQEEYSSPLQTRERSLICSEIDQRVGELLRLYGVPRTGGDAVDLKKLAFQMVVDQFPGLKDDPELLEQFFLLCRIFRTGDEARDYWWLVLRLAQDRLPGFHIGRKAYQHKPSNPWSLLLLLADVETVRREWTRRPSNNEIFQILREEEPFHRQWANRDEKTLANWIADAVDHEKNSYCRVWQEHQSLGELPELIKTINLVVRGEIHPRIEAACKRP